MLTEIQYRTFDELLDSVRIDIPTYNLEGMIEPQQLIKVAIRVNYDLGLKIHQSKSKLIEIEKSKGKLPADFYVLNFALICEDKKVYDPSTEIKKTYTDGILEGYKMGQKNIFFGEDDVVKQFNTVINIQPGSNIIEHNLSALEVVVQALDTTGNILAYELQTPTRNEINIISQAETTVSNVRVTVLGAKTPTNNNCNDVVQISKVCDKSVINVYKTNGKREEYKTFKHLKIEKNKSVSVDCYNVNIKSDNVGVLKNGFLVTNFDEGSVFINYQSLMEDEDGNLLVMDHPIVNEYYEYALKQRIYENLFMSGEPVNNHLQLVELRLRAARNNALSFINTPDFRELRKMWEINRKAQYHNYYNMFKP